MEFDTDGQAAVFNNGFLPEATYDLPTHTNTANDIQPGMSNPMYAWYQPNMSRQECEEYLATQSEGAFVIRDSSFTPGWHMLGVKTPNGIVHERIKLHQDGTYALLPSTGAQQPNFLALPDLVGHYATAKRQGVAFSLALDNPIYDNHLLQEAPQSIRPEEEIYEVDAPSVPVHQNRGQAADDQQVYDTAA